MTWKNEFISLLKQEFEELKKHNPKASLRSFAKMLQVSPSAMSEMLNNNFNWNLTPDRAAHMTQLLPCSEEKKNHLLALIGKLQPQKRLRIVLKDYELLTNLYYMPVVSCFDLPETERQPEKIARRLNIKLAEVNEAIESLLDKNYLQRNSETGAIERNPIGWQAGDGPPDEVIRKFHSNNLKTAQTAINSIDVDERHFSTLTFCGNSEQVKALREEFRTFSEKVKNLMCNGQPKSDVYRFSICLYPLRDLSAE